MSESTHDLTLSRIGGESSPFMRELMNFTRELTLIDKNIVSLEKSSRLDDTLLTRLSEAVQASIEACRQFESQYGEDKELLSLAQLMFLQETNPYFSQSWLAGRARSKPSGFPGDFEMLCKLYFDPMQTNGIGAYLDKIIIDLPLARAVRGRLAMARRFLIQEVKSRVRTQEPIRILDIASGPCREYIDWPSDLTMIDVLAIDSDPKAIDYVNTTVSPQMPNPSRLSSIQYNALRTQSSKATIQKFGKFDIIYSVGLCDYLTDDVLVKLLSAWHDTLSDNGVLFVAFKDAHQYDQTIYQWHFDWFFYQRTVKDLLELYKKAGFALGKIETCRDETGIIIGFFTRRDQINTREK